jgi:ABC-type multidrug transport system fused ATPase/permease subunit
LNEATSALDSRSDRRSQQPLERLLKGRIAIVIAHRLSIILNADKIIVVDHGQVVEIERVQELLNRQGLYSTLFKSNSFLQCAM